ncbi:MAG: hypothetical protein OEN55_18490 [Alphaproteobacteria bacterium]|nr:hypothetical protein [Alphaproteobacteria bacterium]
MKLTTLFLNAMRMSSKIDCRQFAVDPAYQKALERDLCGDVAPTRATRTLSVDKAVTGALSPAA